MSVIKDVILPAALGVSLAAIDYSVTTWQYWLLFLLATAWRFWPEKAK